MKRREFVAGLGMATAWTLAAHGQQASPVIGFLQGVSLEARRNEVAGFKRGLRETGYVEGENVSIEYRFADGIFDRLPALAADLITRKVAVLLAGTQIAALAARAATSTTPIVFTMAGDAVKLGFAASLSRPGGNMTGVTNLANLLITKNLELLHELVPQATQIAYLSNPDNPNADSDSREVYAAAPMFMLKPIVYNARSEQDFEAAFALFVRERAGALLIGADPLFIQWGNRLALLAAQERLPATAPLPEFARTGCLMSYATSNVEAYRQAGVYTGRILKGEKPADLPIQQANKVELIINLKTAKALGLTIPEGLLRRADELID